MLLNVFTLSMTALSSSLTIMNTRVGGLGHAYTTDNVTSDFTRQSFKFVNYYTFDYFASDFDNYFRSVGDVAHRVDYGLGLQITYQEQSFYLGKFHYDYDDGYLRFVFSGQHINYGFYFTFQVSSGTSYISDYVSLLDTSQDEYTEVTFGDKYFPQTYLHFGIYFTPLPDSVVEHVKDYYDDSNVQSAYDSGYNNGLSVGYNDGYSDGVDVSFDQGYATGYSTGLSVGYQEGLHDGSDGVADYSFLALFSAIADTPIMILRNLLGFDVFGVSAISILMTMITGCIVFYLIRKII